MNISAWSRVVAAMMLMAAGAFGQTAGSPGEGLCAVPSNTAGVMQICWWGKAGRTYFLQTNATLNRDTWSYTPVLEGGGNAVLSYSMPSSTGRMFARLVYTDLPTGGNASTADFDGDGLVNAIEVAVGGTQSDPFLADSDWDGYTDGEEVLAGSSPSNPGANPGTAQPLPGNVNPDADYINGIKVEYSRKAMWADYNRSGSEASANTTYRGFHYLPPDGVVAGQDFQPYTAVPGSNAISTMVGLYEGAAFLTQRVPLNGKLTVGVTKVDTSSTSTNGTQQEYHRLERSVVELVKKLSGSAPADVQRTLLGLVTRRYNGVLQSRELGTITLSKLNTSWSPELNSFCKVTTGGNFTFEAPPDGGAPDSNNSSDAESRNESTDVRLMSVEINEVSFSGTGYHQLKSDDGQTTYDAPKWKDVNGDGKGTTDAQTGDKGYPVAYTRGSLPSIGAALKITGMITGQSYEMKATSSQGVEIPPTPITIATDGSVVLPPTPASKGFADKIEFHNAKDNTAFQLDWHIKVGTSNWAKIGSTRHTVCVTNADPANSLTSKQETLFVLACKNAKGQTQAADITAGIWGEFTDRDVRRVDGTQLTYYKNYTCNVTSTEELIKQGDGQCGSWAKLFIDMRKVHGIDDSNEYVLFEPQTAEGFIVKNWTFQGNGRSGHAEYPYLNIPAANLFGTSSYNWKFSEVDDAQGIPGQGNANPASLFNNHQVVIAGEYYDPSYGIKHATLDDIDNNAIEGFYISTSALIDEQFVGVDLNGNGNATDTGVQSVVMLFKKNPNGLDLKELKFDY